MNHNPTGPIPVTPTHTDPRDGLMRALATAETVTASLPHRPTTINIQHECGDAYRIEIYFHRQPQHVLHFAAQYDIQATANPHGTNPEDTYTHAETRINGVIVRAWSLTRNDQPPATPVKQAEDPHDGPLHHDYATPHDLPTHTNLPEALR